MKKLLTVIGAAVAGAAAGILMAPKSGKEIREDIKKKAQEFSFGKRSLKKFAVKAAKPRVIGKRSQKSVIVLGIK